MPQPQVLRAIKIGVLVISLAVIAADAQAGGGPENVLVVVNSQSGASMTVANHYCALRHIPPSNIFHLDWSGSTDSTDIDTFRQKILQPALQAAAERGLGEQIDYVVYSSDFPTRIDFAAEWPAAQRGKQYPSGSLTALTYLYQPVLLRSMQFASPSANRYMRRGDDEIAATHGFRGWYGWGSNGELLESGGERYLLSTMLAVTSGRGNTIPEVLNYLTRSAGADGTLPKGTIYYMSNDNVRSTTRHPGFAFAVDDLDRLGVDATIADGTAPLGKPNVQGAMLGSSIIRWGETGSTIRPGAIVENLTSFGGDLSAGGGQTPLTEFLRYGAAGSSGTVVEPYAIQAKFPIPAIHVHYARGCSLAEAFYQSVASPFQLLVVGDPLCRPWARIPSVRIAGVDANSTVRGQLAIQPSVAPGGPDVDRFELFAGGLRVARCAAGGTLDLDTTQLADGNLELRVVAIDSSPIETQGEAIVNVTVNNHGLTLDLRAMQAKIREGMRIRLSAKAPGTQWIAVFQDSRQIARIVGSEGDLTLESDKMGTGPVLLRAVAKATAADRGYVVARPITIDIARKGI